MKKLKAGVIGIGGIAKGAHLPALESNDKVEVIALCDIRKKRAEKKAKEMGIKKVYKDYKNLLDIREIDLVHICTPNNYHSIIAVEALKKGKHVLCEKPDAINVDEVLKMKKASENSNKVLMTVRNNRFLSDFQFLNEYLTPKKREDIYAAKCGWIRVRGIPGKGGWFTTKAKSGGGPLIDLGVHMIDVVVWLMGNPKPVSVMGSTYRKFAEEGNEDNKNEGTFDVEDLAMGFVKFDNGVTLALEFSWASNIEQTDRYIELLGSDFGAKWHSKDSNLKLFTEINGRTTIQKPNILSGGGHYENIDHFLNSFEYRPGYLLRQPC
ncbi:MAG: Gfo/Idh/MocA family protein, partial [Bacillota bacterium]